MVCGMLFGTDNLAEIQLWTEARLGWLRHFMISSMVLPYTLSVRAKVEYVLRSLSKA